jgi:hypothetical protein
VGISGQFGLPISDAREDNGLRLQEFEGGVLALQQAELAEDGVVRPGT